jgi:hypothetical protein
MVAPEVASLMVTVCALVKLPAAGENVGVAAVAPELLMVYVALATALLVSPEATAMASMVSVEETVIALV